MNDDKSSVLTVQELSDHEEIRRIFVEYARYLDAGDHAGSASLFASDGVMAAEIGDAVGPAAIEAAIDAALSPSTRATFPSAVHVMNNQSIDVDGDHATTEVLWFYLTTDDDGVPTVLQAADLLVHPTYADALPTSLIEALATGTPTIATRVGGVPEVVGDSGELVGVGDVAALTESMVALAGDPDRRHQMSVISWRM